VTDAKSVKSVRELILSVNDLPRENVHVPEWDVTLCVQGLTGKQREEFESAMLVRKGKRYDVDMRDMRARLVALAVVDADTGERIFNDADIPKLSEKSGAALERIVSVAQRLSGLDEGALYDEKN